jgi:hypothetical protein
LERTVVERVSLMIPNQLKLEQGGSLKIPIGFNSSLSVPQCNASRYWLKDINHSVKPVGESIALNIPEGEQVYDHGYAHDAKHPSKNDCRGIVSIVQNPVFDKKILESKPISEPLLKSRRDRL